MITEQDAHNIVAFLDRVECKGIREADLLVYLVNKLQKIKDEDEAT